MRMREVSGSIGAMLSCDEGRGTFLPPGAALERVVDTAVHLSELIFSR